MGLPHISVRQDPTRYDELHQLVSMGGVDLSLSWGTAKNQTWGYSMLEVLVPRMVSHPEQKPLGVFGFHASQTLGSFTKRKCV